MAKGCFIVGLAVTKWRLMLAQSITDRIGLSRITMCMKIKSSVNGVGSFGVLLKINANSLTCSAHLVGNVAPTSLPTELNAAHLGMGLSTSWINRC
jgi:hypothetical protein